MSRILRCKNASRAVAGAVVLLTCLSSHPLGAAAWYDDYYAGVEALKKKDAIRAIEHLQKAIKKRPEPGEMLIAYGTIRVSEYYPYLKLAEAQLLAGRLDAARDTLEQSDTRAIEPAAERRRLLDLVEKAAAKTTNAVATTAAETREPLREQPAPQTQAQASSGRAPQPPPIMETNGTIVIESDPAEATVLLGGRLIGSTPLQMQLPAGTYRLTLRAEGMLDHSFSVRVRAGSIAREDRTLTPLPKPQIETATSGAPPEVLIVATFVSDPPGALVILDGDLIGRTDPATGKLVSHGLALGSHEWRMSLPGHAERSGIIRISASGPNYCTARLAALPVVVEPPSRAGTYGGIGAALSLALMFLYLRRLRSTRVAAVSLHHVTPENRAAPPTVVVGAPLASASTPETFGEYRLLDVLGKGGMAVVYKAEKRGELFALKRPLPALMAERQSLARFAREAEIGRTLHHPNIIRVVDQGEVHGVPFFTMELLRGETLRALINRVGILDARGAGKIAAQVAEALDYAHSKGVIHRDLKPTNIMLTTDHVVKVMDYGIARASRCEPLTTTGFFLGTANYVSPEVVEGKTPDARSDLYSLGVILYEVLTGRMPHEADSSAESYGAAGSVIPVPPSQLGGGCPPQLESIILKLLRKRPEERYQSAEALVIDLAAFVRMPG